MDDFDEMLYNVGFAVMIGLIILIAYGSIILIGVVYGG